MPRAFSDMTSFRPTVNPPEFKLRRARRIADFFCLVVEPARPRSSGRRSRDGVLRGSRFSVISRMTYFRDFPLDPKILIARTFFMMRRRWALSAFDSVGLVSFFLAITSDNI